MDRRLVIVAWSLAVLVGGCSHVITNDTPYYADGPDQLEPPQGDVTKGTWVLVVGERGDYFHVLTTGGVSGFVWKRAVAPILEFRKQEKDGATEAERQKRLERAGLKPAGPPAEPQPTSPPNNSPARM